MTSRWESQPRRIGEAKSVEELLDVIRRQELAGRVASSAWCSKRRVQTRRLMHAHRVPR